MLGTKPLWYLKFCNVWSITLTTTNSPWNTLAAWLIVLLCQLFVAFPGQPESLAFVPLSLFKIMRKVIAMELQLQIYSDASSKALSFKDKKFCCSPVLHIWPSEENWLTAGVVSLKPEVTVILVYFWRPCLKRNSIRNEKALRIGSLK